MSDAGRGDPSDLAVTLRQLWEQSHEVVEARVAVLEALALAALDGEAGDEGREEAASEAHKLAGTLGTFGFPEGSRAARELEILLRAPGTLADDRLLRLVELVVAIQEDLERSPLPPGEQAEPEPGPVPGPPAPAHVLIVDGETETARRLVEAAAGAGLTAASVPEAAAVLAALDRHRPELVVLDPASAGDRSLAVLTMLGTLLPPVPALVLTDPGSGVDRVAVARAGGIGLLEKPMAPAAVIEAVSRSLLRVAAGATVLVVDDDPQLIDLAGMLLRRRGLRVEGLADPRRFWEVLDRVRPELLVLDVDMPHVDGLELCRMVRGNEAWSRVPVVIVTARAGPEDVRRAYEVGADDHVAKPVDAEEFVTRVLNRIVRTRHSRELWETDAATGLANQRGFQQHTARLVDLAHRRSEGLGIAVLRPDQGGAHRAALLGQAVRRSLAPGDVVGWVGPDAVGVGLYGAGAPEAAERIGAVLDAFRADPDAAVAGGSLPATASAGLARFPDDGGDAAALLRAAAAALEVARTAGGDQLRLAGRQPADATGPAVDVLIVDDDEALGRLLVHALTTRGYRTEWLEDGSQVADRLSERGDLGARVVLLDVGLPGLDGLSLLREMARRGVLSRTRVVMVTLRSTEAEVLAALDLGAFDHVAKPFSLPVLLHRVRRAMESL